MYSSKNVSHFLTFCSRNFYKLTKGKLLVYLLTSDRSIHIFIGTNFHI